MSKITLLLISLFVFQNIQATEIQARLALLIGNSDYKGDAFLANPVNDAQDLAAVLSDLQFQVSHRQNLTRAEMNSAIEEFGQNLKATKGMGIFYYAGHGMQVGGENYLIPIGGERALFEDGYKLDKNTIKASNILKTLEAADNAVNIIILDACRNNPFPKTRGISRRPTPPGLQMMNAPGGSLIAYSADQGEVAFEGKDKRNSPYAASLIQQIKDNPNSSLLQLFTKVRADVFQKTGEFQAPGFYSKLNQDYCLMGACSKEESSIDLGELIQQVAHLWQPILAVVIAFGVLWLGWRRNLVGAVVTTFVEYRAGKIERKKQIEITRRRQTEIRQKRQAEVEYELEQRKQAEFRQRPFEVGQRKQAEIRQKRQEQKVIENYDKALQFKSEQKIKSVNTGDYQKWFDRGNELLDSKNFEKAIEYYDKVLQFKSDHYDAWNNRGWALHNLGRHQEAIENYNKALQFKPNHCFAWINRGNALCELGHYQEAIENYDKALQFKPDDYGVWYSRGLVLEDLGHYETAIESYDKALAIKPDSSGAWNNRGIILGKLGRYQEAIESSDKALRIEPNDELYQKNRKMALEKLN
ncbi:MAG: tetratricopeptide repeat protein, partial [Candidatus Parabeggiatoa sp.]|nr:tetratricopeptide repeat protein [Candidatus Parabeggiatoa sp.]